MWFAIFRETLKCYFTCTPKIGDCLWHCLRPMLEEYLCAKFLLTGAVGTDSIQCQGQLTVFGARDKNMVLRWIVEYLSGLGADLRVLRSIWFKKLSGDTHAERLDNFYKSQANAYDRFRRNFLHGREKLVEELAIRLRDKQNVVWVDLGGGTAENVDMMSKYMPLDRFKKIYVVDLCSSLCKIALEKVAKKGWRNVTVIEEDACVFSLPADVARNSLIVVTFSYSLSMIPPFHSAVDNAMDMIGKDGMLGITDFYVSGKFDKPDRQMPTLSRWFWRCTFDTDNIDIGPERRAYLDHCGQQLFEFNSSGTIPYVPLLKAPYYIWIGMKKN